MIPDLAGVRERLVRVDPEWQQMQMVQLPSAGTDNVLFRLGRELCLRVPKVEWAATHVDKEWRWLPRLAPLLPFTVPEPVALIAPDEVVPWPWLVVRWIDGSDLDAKPLADGRALATDLASFILDLQKIDATGGPAAGADNFHRGVPLSKRDRVTRHALAQVADELETDTLTAVWEHALAAPVHPGQPVWVHGDLHAGNLLGRDGSLRAVIDFGGLGVGDPAVDLMPAWTLLPDEARGCFFAQLGAGEALIRRSSGWAMSIAVVALVYYRDSGHPLAASSRRVLRKMLADPTFGC